MIRLKQTNGRSKYAFVIIFTVGYIAVCILGMLLNGQVFLIVFPAMTVIETIIVKDLFEREKAVVSNV